jgi:hypothetical protein
MKIIATKAQRHQGFIFNKTFCVTLCLRVLVAIFIEGHRPDKPELKRKICHQDTKTPRVFIKNFLCVSWCHGAFVAIFFIFCQKKFFSPVPLNLVEV